MSEKEKKQAQPLMLTGFRSYAEEVAERERGQAKGKGKGKGGASGTRGAADQSFLQFCWPQDESLGVECDEDEDADKDAGADVASSRYVDREVLSDHGDESDAALVSSKTAINGEYEEEGEEDDDESSSEEEEDVSGLDKRLQDLPLQDAIAGAGRQEGMLCCLDGIEAVLRTLLPGRPNLPEKSMFELQSAVAQLTSLETDQLEKLRRHLAACGDASCDWEPLERVLALRPLFFRLLRSAKGGNTTGAIGPKSGIGPGMGPKSSSGDGGGSPDAAWLTWKFAAQATVQALGETEQQWLRAYVHYCVEQRAAQAPRAVPKAQNAVGQAGGAKTETKPAAGFERNTSNDFPTLADGDAAFPTLGAAPAAPTVNWGKGMKKPPPPAIVPDRSAGPADAWDDEDGEEPQESFPSLGGGSGISAVRYSAPKASWGGHATHQSSAAASLAAVLPKAAKPKATGPPKVLSEFPSLGGAKASDAGASEGWAAQAKARAASAKAKPEVSFFAPKKPEPPKEFNNAASAFPDLPMGAPKPKSAAGKAGARAAKAKVSVKSKGAAKAAASAVVEEDQAAVEEEEPVQLVPDEQLVLIHDPLDAVARTEAAEAERRANKKTKKPSARNAAFRNPWIASSS